MANTSQSEQVPQDGEDSDEIEECIEKQRMRLAELQVTDDIYWRDRFVLEDPRRASVLASFIFQRRNDQVRAKARVTKPSHNPKISTGIPPSAKRSSLGNYQQRIVKRQRSSHNTQREYHESRDPTDASLKMSEPYVIPQRRHLPPPEHEPVQQKDSGQPVEVRCDVIRLQCDMTAEKDVLSSNMRIAAQKSRDEGALCHEAADFLRGFGINVDDDSTTIGETEEQWSEAIHVSAGQLFKHDKERQALLDWKQ